MSVSVSYPGVYIEELPSGQHTITGVATSIAAFIGWANQGPVGQAVMVESWAQYQATFGGLIPGIYLGYAVYQFFLNGGSQTYIVRLVETAGQDTIAGTVTSGTFTGGEGVKQSGSGATATLIGTVPAAGPMLVTSLTGSPDLTDLWIGISSTAEFKPVGPVPTVIAATTASNVVGGLPLYASNPGAWGNTLSVMISKVNSVTNTFNLQVLKVNGNQTSTLESYTNLSTSPVSPQFAVTVINSDSNYVTFTPPGGTAPASITLPTATFTSTIAGAATGTFVAGEEVSQAVTAATAYVIGTVAAAGPMTVGPVTGTADATHAWTGSTSAATFAASGAPTLTTASASLTLDGGTSTTTGADGTALVPGDGNFETQLTSVTGGYSLLSSVFFNILCVPGETSASVVGNLQEFCTQYRAFLLVDSAYTAVVGTGSTGLSATGPADGTGASLVTQYATNAAFYFPWILAPDPQVGFRPALFPPCGFMAGIFASTDSSRGVWKAPAGIEASLTGALGLQYVLTDLQNGSLNPLGINCLRQFSSYGNVVWGARTIAGSDAAGSQWQYIPIRRLALFLESSLYNGTQWVVFEPNAEPLWGQVRLSIGTFMQGLFLQGAFAGTTPQQAYFVKCDDENNPDSSVAMGILNVTVGFAPLYPAEFVIIQIQQIVNPSGS